MITAEFKVIEFNKEFRRVVASHMAIYKESEAQIVKSAGKRAKQSSEDESKPTFGDANDTLQKLKDEMGKQCLIIDLKNPPLWRVFFMINNVDL